MADKRGEALREMVRRHNRAGRRLEDAINDWIDEKPTRKRRTRANDEDDDEKADDDDDDDRD